MTQVNSPKEHTTRQWAWQNNLKLCRKDEKGPIVYKVVDKETGEVVMNCNDHFSPIDWKYKKTFDSFISFHTYDPCTENS